MTQRRKRYGRSTMPNPNAQNFMAEMRKTALVRKSKFEAQDTATVTAARPPRATSFSLPKIRDPPPRPQKRPLDLDVRETDEMPPPKRFLPSPPEEARLSFTETSPLHVTTTHTKQQLQRRQRPQAKSCPKDAYPLSLPTPPHSEKESSPGGSSETTVHEEGPCLTYVPISFQSHHIAKSSECKIMNKHVTPFPATPRSTTADSPIFRLSVELLGEILQYTLPGRPSGRHVYPYYRKGMLAGGLWSDPLNDEGVVDRDNIDVAVLSVCRAFYQVGADIFYGQSRFCFSNPDAFAWWARRLRPQTFQRIKSLALQIGTEWTISRARGHNFKTYAKAVAKLNRPVFDDMCHEEKWCNVFAIHIRPLRRLRYLHIQFAGWRSVHPHQWWLHGHVMTLPEDRWELHYWRNQLLHFMHENVRGIETVLVDCVKDFGEVLHNQHKDMLEESMKQPRPTTGPDCARPRATLQQALAQVRSARI